MPKKVNYDTIKISAIHTVDGKLDRVSEEHDRGLSTIYDWLERNTDRLIIYKKKGEEITPEWLARFFKEKDALKCN